MTMAVKMVHNTFKKNQTVWLDTDAASRCHLMKKITIIPDVQRILSQPYKYGFTTNVEVEDFPKGISDDVIKLNFFEEKRASVHVRFQA